MSNCHVFLDDPGLSTQLCEDLRHGGHAASFCTRSSTSCNSCPAPSPCEAVQDLLGRRTSRWARRPVGPLEAGPTTSAAGVYFCDIGLLLERVLSRPATVSPRERGCSLVLVSWLGSNDDVVALAQECGASAILPVPWEPEELLVLVERAARGRARCQPQARRPVLVVEDDVLQLEHLCRLLNDLGFQACGATTGAEALSLVDRTDAGMLLTDHHLPDMDGIELMTRFRELYPDVGSVLMTAYGTEQTVRQAMLAGAADYLPKPVDRESLEQVLRQARWQRLVRALQGCLRKQHQELRTALTSLRQREAAESQLREELLHAERLASVGALLSEVAHELNNPLAAVVGFSELAEGEANCPETVKGDLQIVKANAERCRKLVVDLLTIVRKGAAEMTPGDLHQSIQSVVQLRRHHLECDGVLIETSLDPLIPQVTTDHQKVMQVVLNLLNNAADAVMASGRTGVIRIGTSRHGACVRVSVTDDGPAVAPEIARRMFEPFFTTKPEGKGTGLGLAICNDIARLLGGKLDFTNESGGVTFTLTLPIAVRPIPQPASAPGNLSLSGLAGARILVVDDERDLLRLVDRVLKAEGAHVVLLDDGRLAVERLLEASFDLVICDLRMPHLSGREVFEKVTRSKPEMAGRFLFASGDLMGDSSSRFLSELAGQVLPKPYDRDGLLRAVSRCLQQSRAQQAGARAGA